MNTVINKKRRRFSRLSSFRFELRTILTDNDHDHGVSLWDSPSGERVELGELIECGLKPLDRVKRTIKNLTHFHDHWTFFSHKFSTIILYLYQFGMEFERINSGYQRYQEAIGPEFDNDQISCVVCPSTTSYSCFYRRRYGTTFRR